MSIYFSPWQVDNSDMVYATSSPLGKAIQEFQNNLRSAIDNTIQTIIGNDDCQFSFSVNLQTQDNEKSVSTSRNYCNNEILSTLFPIDDKYDNLNGQIASIEFGDSHTELINTLTGNWSFRNTAHNEIDFNSLFVKQPFAYSKTSDSRLANITFHEQGSSESIFYNVSNFHPSSVSESNSNIKFKGTGDIIRETAFENRTISNNIDSFKGVSVSLILFNSKNLLVYFDQTTPLYQDFKSIPIIGISS